MSAKERARRAESLVRDLEGVLEIERAGSAALRKIIERMEFTLNSLRQRETEFQMRLELIRRNNAMTADTPKLYYAPLLQEAFEAGVSQKRSDVEAALNYKGEWFKQVKA